MTFSWNQLQWIRMSMNKFCFLPSGFDFAVILFGTLAWVEAHDFDEIVKLIINIELIQTKSELKSNAKNKFTTFSSQKLFSHFLKVKSAHL